MKFITRESIQDWAERFESKGYFPLVISKLVRASTPYSTRSNFPSGSAVFVGGYDGIVSCDDATPYVPKGISLWEFGTQESNNTKAESDYLKRTKDPLGHDISKRTFIFATPTFWRDKDTWRQAKLEEGKWMNIIVIDSTDLEQWFSITPAVAHWFSTFIGSYPYSGILTTEIFWEEWSVGPLGTLLPECVTTGREYQSKELESFFRNPPGIKAVKASSKDEAIAFIVASAKLFDIDDSESFFSRSLIVDTTANFRALSINKNKLILIVKIDETGPLYKGVTDGNHILVPLGADDDFNQDIITLPKITREGLLKSLITMGLQNEEALKLIKQSTGNITILKKLLKFSQTKYTWALLENARDVIPALLIGRWNEDKIGDRELLEKVSGVEYEEYISRVSKWKSSEAPPVLQIGNTWRLTAPLDSWAELMPLLLKADLGHLANAFQKVFIEAQDDFSIPTYPNFSTVETKYTRWLREGLLQSLILVGYYGNKLKVPTLKEPQLWVDKLISNLLQYANVKQWQTISNELPLIAEASPEEFLSCVNESIDDKNGLIQGLFNVNSDVNNSNDKHAGLLWALEGLAWLPNFFLKSVLILSKLAALEIPIKIVNSPLNSLKEIFKTWHFQTLANYEQRVNALNIIINRYPKVGWSLLVTLIPEANAIAHPTAKMRWRMFDISTTIEYTYQETWQINDFAIIKLLELFDDSVNKFIELIELSVNFSSEKKKDVLTLLIERVKHLKDSDFLVLKSVRTLISNHRSYKEADWALKDADLKLYEQLYNLLLPTDEVTNALWLFNDPWPQLPEGLDDENPEQISTQLLNRRRRVIDRLYELYGTPIIWRICEQVKEPYILGDTIAYKIDNTTEELELCSQLGTNESFNLLISGFISRKSFLIGLPWVFTIYENLEKIIKEDSLLAHIFLPVAQRNDLIEYIDSIKSNVREYYWTHVSPFLLDVSVENKIKEVRIFLEIKRISTAIIFSFNYHKELPTDILQEVLMKAAIVASAEEVRYQNYHITYIFQEIYSRNDHNVKILLELEWLYLTIFDNYGSRVNPKYLHLELSSNPSFFVDLLYAIYRPDEGFKEPNDTKLNPELKKINAEKAYHLLKDWRRMPGSNDNNNLNAVYLKKWVEDVRKIATERGRLKAADIQLGQLFGQFPRTGDQWPPLVISEIIENIGTSTLINNFETAIFNSRGVTTRSVFEGGQQERHLATILRQYASGQQQYPKVEKALLNLAKRYEEYGRQEDDEAERDRLEHE